MLGIFIFESRAQRLIDSAPRRVNPNSRSIHGSNCTANHNLAVEGMSEYVPEVPCAQVRTDVSI